MNNPAQPPASRALRTLWRSPIPRQDAHVAFAPSGERVAVGTSGSVDGHSVGSLTVFDTRTGGVVHQIADDWQVTSLAFSPDSRSLAISDARSRLTPDEQRIRILDADTFVERCRYTGDLTSATQSLSFSRDGGWVAARKTLFGTPGSLAYVFDATDGTQRWRRDIPIIFSLALSPDSGSAAVGSNHIFASGRYGDGVTVLDALTGAERFGVTTPSQVWSVAYSPDNRWIVAGYRDGTICVFDAGSGAQLWEVREENAEMSSVAVSDDGRWIAAFGLLQDENAGILGVYDLARGRPRFPPVRIEAHSFWVPDPVLYSPTLRHIAVQGGRGVIVIDARTGVEYARTGPNDRCAAFAPDGGSIVVGLWTDSAGFVDMFDLGVEVSRCVVDASLTSVDVSPSGTPLVAVADTSSAVTVVVASSGARLARKPTGTIASVVFTDGGQAVAAGGGRGVLLFSIVGDRLWKVDTIGAVSALAAVGPAGEWIAAAASKTVRLLSSVDGHSRWPSPNTHPQPVTRIASSRDGKWIATGCTDRKTRIIDALTGTETFSVGGDGTDGTEGAVRAVVFQPNGSLLATGNEDGRVVLIDAATASVRGRVTRLFGCSHIAFSFDGALLAAAWDDYTVSIFDITTSSSPPPKLQEFAYTAPISGLAFNPADNSVAVATAAASIAVHDARDGIELVRILHPKPAAHFAFSADGALIATISDDGIVRVWTSGSPPSDRMIKGVPLSPDRRGEPTMEAGRIERNPDAPEVSRLTRSGRELDREAADRLDEIRQYFQDLYQRREVIARTTTPSGQELDWIPAESQVSGTVAEPPYSEPPHHPRDRARPTYPVPFDLAESRAEVGPPGTVPVLRKPIDQIRPVGDLQDYLAKGPRQRRLTPPDDPRVATASAPDPDHKYAHAYQPVTNFGTEGTINTWRPYVQWSNEFSLGQLWLVRGSGIGVQTCEVGAQTFYDLYGDWYPHLFIFYTTNHYTHSGDNLGGYNTDVAGWVQRSTQVFPGMRLAESVQGGDQYDLTLKVTLSQGNWWVRVGNEWMGYYPNGLYNAAGLRDQAASVDWGGEIVDDLAHHPEPTATWMGSGHYPNEGWQHAAYMRNLAYQSDAAGTMAPIQGYPSVTNPAAYQIATDFSGTSTWGSNFYWGGPGGVS